jgi:hypothetical protein
VVLLESVAGNSKRPKVERVLAAAGAMALAGAVAVVALFDPSTESFFPVCPLYKVTGLACPGCGLTRGMHALLHGDVLAALDLNALTPVFAAGGLFFIVSLVLLAVRGRGLKMNVYRPWMLGCFLVVMLAFGVLRNLPIYPFNVLYP